MLSRNDLFSTWGEFLERESWDLFATFTFRETISLDKAKREFKRFFKYLNSKTNPFFDKFIRTFIVFERNPGRPGVHIHCLIKGINPTLASKISDKWKGESKVLPYNPKEGARFYLANICLSPERIEHYDRFTINSRYRNKHH